ncbi:MAG: magnesium transporter [Erythrobacter cryptus]
MTTTNPAIISAHALRVFLRGGDFASITTALGGLPPADLAHTLANLSSDEIADILAALAPDLAARAFGYFDPAQQVAIARALPRARLQQLFTDMPHDERADLWKSLPEAERDALLPGLAAADREDVRRLASYAEGTAGSIMTSDYVALRPDLTASAAIAVLRREAPDRETIYDCYVIDEARRLIGVVSLRDLLLAPDDRKVSEIMTRQVVSVRAEDSKETVAERIAEYDLLAIPVINGGDAMVGIVTVDDALDVAEMVQTRRLTRFGGTAAMGAPDIDLRATPFATMFKVRAFWLVVLTVFGVITSTFVAEQEEILSQIIILAAFMAPIVDMGGNTGSQSATLVIRAMALGQIGLNWRDLLFVIRRELPVALTLGVVIAALEAILAFFSKGVGGEILLVVGLAMAACTVLGALIGALLPFAAKRLGTDPATLSSPLITSIMDLLGVFIYFGLAQILLADLLK